MHSDWFSGIDILHGRGQHGEKVGYCYPSGLEKTLCKRDMYVPLVTKGLMAHAVLRSEQMRFTTFEIYYRFQYRSNSFLLKVTKN
jgi:hypothetical protein